MPRNLQIILRFSLIFYDILQFSLNFSIFLRIFAPENPLPVKKGCGVIIFIKVLKNDEALPSAMDSRVFFLWGPAMESLRTGVRGRYGDKKAVTLSFLRYGGSFISMSIFSFFI